VFAPSDYAFDLPDALIAQQPAATREASRLLHVRSDGTHGDHTFADIVELLPTDAVLIANDTRVIPARVPATKPSGGKVELLFLEPLGPEELEALIGDRGRSPGHHRGLGLGHASEDRVRSTAARADQEGQENAAHALSVPPSVFSTRVNL